MARTKIIDISQWQGDIDFDALKGNVDTVIIRMGYTRSTTGDICIDQKYVHNRLMCKQKNIPYSLYYITSAITEEEAKREAQFVAYECRDLSKYVLPVFCDTEIISGSGRADTLTKEQRTACVKAFCDTLQYMGVPAGIYTGDNFWQHNLDGKKLKQYSLWIASWGVDKPAAENWLLWQYTNSGTVPGITGRVDMSTEEKPAGGVVDHRQNVINRALAEVGYLEKKSGDLAYLYNPTANAGTANFTKYGYELHSLKPARISYPDYWCMDFISWLFVKEYGLAGADRALCGSIEDYCPQAVAYFLGADRWSKTPQEGALIFFKNGAGVACHVGLVYKVIGGTIYTIEGNTSGASGVIANGGGVCIKSYLTTNSRILGYGLPRY